MTLSASKNSIQKAIRDTAKNLLKSCQNIQKLCQHFNLAEELGIHLQQLETEAGLLTSLEDRKQADDFIKSIHTLRENVSKHQKTPSKKKKANKK